MTCPINSSDWRVVNQQIETRIARFQNDLCRPDLNEVGTALLRGRIAELRALQAWGNPPQEVSG